ncbi:MAG: hypothetical protein IPP43_13630 [Chitinophagaceae bacterium]|nr:hypothetical protein [Chitinophagaceae bacterium]
MIRTVSLQNKGNEDAIMVPFVSGVGHKPGIENPQLSLFSTQQIANLTNKAIFQNTYLYLAPTVLAVV